MQNKTLTDSHIISQSNNSGLVTSNQCGVDSSIPVCTLPPQPSNGDLSANPSTAATTTHGDFGCSPFIEATMQSTDPMVQTSGGTSSDFSSNHNVQSGHHMITLSKSGIYKPKVYLSHTEASYLKESLSNSNWYSVMYEEIDALRGKKYLDTSTLTA